MECNTRRFVTDDRRELQYRVEVQNRVYKKEMAALDAEILKLQKLLESNSTSSSSDMSLLHSIKHEIAIVSDTITNHQHHQQSQCVEPRTPSIGGGLPLLLLSVLPPVIPRASWPSSDHAIITPMRRSVTFCSQPHLDNNDCQIGIARLPAIDLLNLRLTHQQATTDASVGLLDRIKGIFGGGGSRLPSSARKDSTISMAEAPSVTIKKRISKLTGLVSCQTAVSCNALHTTTNRMVQKSPLAKTAVNTISRSSGELSYNHVFDRGMGTMVLPATLPPPPPVPMTEFGIGAFTKYGDGTEPRVIFKLPDNRRPSSATVFQTATLRERVKGSPRFPHRIAPTSSLSALFDDKYDDLDDDYGLAKKDNFLCFFINFCFLHFSG